MPYDTNVFDIRVNEADEACLILELSGEIDLAVAPRLRETLLRNLNTHRCALVVDLAGVTFIDSTGLNALVAGHRRAKQLQRPYVVAGLRPPARKLFEMTSLDVLIPIYVSAADACATYSGTDREPRVTGTTD